MKLNTKSIYIIMILTKCNAYLHFLEILRTQYWDFQTYLIIVVRRCATKERTVSRNRVCAIAQAFLEILNFLHFSSFL